MAEEELYLSYEQREHAQNKFKVPVDSFKPSTWWIISLDSESLMPTDRELLQIKSFGVYLVRSIYNEHWQKKILEEKPMPACGRHNTTIFRKGLRNRRGDFPAVQDDNWFYRQWSWEIGPLYVPDIFDKNYKGLSLVKVMDRSRSLLAERWAKWKRDHKEIFEEEEVK